MLKRGRTLKKGIKDVEVRKQDVEVDEKKNKPT